MSRFFYRFITLITIGFLASCGSPKSYYLLTAEGPAPSGGKMGIGLGPVSLPDYLKRSNLVFQESGNRLSLAENHRWAGSLDNNITSVLAANLGRRMHTGDVRSYPWGSDQGLRYQISIDVQQFHGTARGDAVLEATWRVYSLSDRRMIHQKSWLGTEPLTNDGYDALAAAQSRLLAQLATQIAKSL